MCRSAVPLGHMCSFVLIISTVCFGLSHYPDYLYCYGWSCCRLRDTTVSLS